MLNIEEMSVLDYAVDWYTSSTCISILCRPFLDVGLASYWIYMFMIFYSTVWD